ncbi:MAG: alpha/beta hydrolase [Methanomicrobiales archaeon]|jgi:pimeloyl-ACP methyl ester carboxylesterase|nr:alpha/beta hydrolase [Methanomicrobiales archaeon]
MNYKIENESIHKSVKINGNTLHYFVNGNEEGKTIVFLHPAFGDHTCFDKQVHYFSPSYHIISIDLLGHGLTGVGKSKDKITETAKHIAEILKLENRENAHIVGVSLGSLLAQDFALKYPEKVLSLTGVGGYNINRKQKEIATAQRKELAKWLFKAIFSMNAFRRYVASITVIDQNEQARFYESASFFTRTSFTVMSGLNSIIQERIDIQRKYPLLILVGDKDAELALKSANQWHTEEVNSEFHIIEQAGHCANMDNAVQFNQILMNFLTTK